MITVKVYDKETMAYVGNITISTNDIRKYEKDFILK